MSEVILKIGVLVYNHAPYIAETLDSVLNQKTRFKYEIYVFEDCSTDNSREILQKYALEHPDKIKLVLNEKNFGDYWNLRLNFKNLDAKYFALLDGDDRWNSDQKIETMLSILETNPQFVGVAHNVKLEFDDGRPSVLLNSQPFSRSEHTIHDLVAGYCYHHTSSLIYRNHFRPQIPQIFFHPYSGDWFLSMIMAENGDIKYLDEVWSVYRIHQKGMWSQMTEVQKQMRNIDATFHYNRLLDYRYDQGFGRMHYEIMKLLPQLSRSQKLKYELLICSMDVEKNRLRRQRKFFRPLVKVFCENVKLRKAP